jgi:hypothetical protein
MAGFREFVTGEVLTAANVDDFLAKQAVMKFADAAARDSALGTAVAGGNALREGMVAYLDDEDLPSFYNGTTWTTEFGGGGLVQVQYAVLTTAFSTTSATPVDTGLSVTITPTSADNDIIVICNFAFSQSVVSNQNSRAIITDGSNNDLLPGAANVSSLMSRFGETTLDDMSRTSVSLLHSPATISAFTYKLRAFTGGTTMFINRSGNNSFTSQSTIIAMEVKV